MVVSTDNYSNTIIEFLKEMPRDREDRFRLAINLRTIQIVGVFPTLADLLAVLHYLARRIQVLDPSFVIADDVERHQIYSLIEQSDHMYNSRDFDQRFNETLNNLLNSSEKKNLKRKDIASHDDNKKSYKKPKDDFDDSSNNPSFII